MQGRPGQGGKGQDPRDRSSTSAFRMSDLTGRQPVVPKRPPGMTRIDQPPATPRVARPEREVRKPRTWKWWLGCTGGLLVLGVVAAMVVYGVTNLFLAINATGGSGVVVSDFLSSLKAANYDQAYKSLDPTLTVETSRTDFKQNAQNDDRCYGRVTDYNEVAGSAVSKTIGGIQTMSYTFAIERSKLKKPYNLTLTLQKDATGDWTIVSYGRDLGPAVPTC